MDLPDVLWEGAVGELPGNSSFTSSVAAIRFNPVPLSKQALWVNDNSGQPSWASDSQHHKQQ